MRLRREPHNSCNLGGGMTGMIYGTRTPVMDAVMKSVIAQRELNDNLLVKCRQCGERVEAEAGNRFHPIWTFQIQ